MGIIYLPRLSVPFYFARRRNLFDGVPDNVLALAAPGVAYWTTSLFFYYIDAPRWTWLDKYQIHESDEVKSRNRAAQSQVFWSWVVILQHTLQILIGYYWLSDPRKISPSKCMMEMEAIGKTLVHLVRWAVGPMQRTTSWRSEVPMSRIPVAQLFFSLSIVDTRRYFIYRWMHSNKYFYKIHSMHHRLYVPYAFGASYSRPLEGFLIDFVSVMMAETVVTLSVR